jgi:Protein of unknown function (DUF1524)
MPSNDFRRVVIDFDVSTALPLVLFLELEAHLDEMQSSQCLATVESFIARRVFTGEENKEYNILFVEVTGSLKGLIGAQVLPALQKKLLAGGGTTRQWPTDAEIIDKAISRPVFGGLRTAALRLILERLELSMRSKKSETHEIPEGMQIEHVMPQAWAPNWPLEGKTIPGDAASFPHLAKGDIEGLQDAIRRRNLAVQTLGNLTLLNKYLNPAASNSAFGTKLDEYRNSVLQLNRHFDLEKSWDEAAIASRGKNLGEAICRIWPRPDPTSSSPT